MSLYRRRQLDLTPSSPRHLLHRRSEAAYLRFEVLHPSLPYICQARLRSGSRHRRERPR